MMITRAWFGSMLARILFDFSTGTLATLAFLAGCLNALEHIVGASGDLGPVGHVGLILFRAARVLKSLLLVARKTCLRLLSAVPATSLVVWRPRGVWAGLPPDGKGGAGLLGEGAPGLAATWLPGRSAQARPAPSFPPSWWCVCWGKCWEGCNWMAGAGALQT